MHRDAPLIAAAMGVGATWALTQVVPAVGVDPGPAGAWWLGAFGAAAATGAALLALRGQRPLAAAVALGASAAVVIAALWTWLGSASPGVGLLSPAYGPRSVGWGLGFIAGLGAPALLAVLAARRLRVDPAAPDAA